MLIPVLLFILGFVLLIKGGDWFVDGSCGIAHRFHLPELLIGATIVSIGTTLPEVMVSATSAVTGHGEIAYGNAIGSVICNAALIAALTVALKPSDVDGKTFRLPVIFFFSAAALYTVFAAVFKFFYAWSGLILLAVFVLYMVMNVREIKKMPQPAESKEEEKSEDEDEDEKPTTLLNTVLFVLCGAVCVTAFILNTFVSMPFALGIILFALLVLYMIAGALPVKASCKAFEDFTAKKSFPLIKDILLLVIGAVCIALGADLLVDNGTLIAKALGVPESVIALTLVALGTSLPELVTAVTSLIKGHSSLSLGNVIGANLFNLVLVSGLSTVLSPFSLPESKLIAGMNSSLIIDIPLMFITMAILTLPSLATGKLKRWQGISLLIIYAAFCVYQFAF